MALEFKRLAPGQISAVGFRVGNLEKVGRNGAAIVAPEPLAYVMAGGPQLRRVERCRILQELLRIASLLLRRRVAIPAYPRGPSGKDPDPSW